MNSFFNVATDRTTVSPSKNVAALIIVFCVSPLSAFAQDKVRVETQYDARGQVLRQSFPYFPGETVRWMEYRHDGLDRQILVTHPDSKTSSTRYFPGDSFSAIEVTDENGNKRVTHFDAFGNEVHRDRFDDGVQMRTTYQYDVLDRLTGITDALGSEWTYLYDGHGNRVLTQDPDLGCRQMTYDAANRLIEQRAADGALITYAYDELDRVVSKVVDKDALQYPDCSSNSSPSNDGPVVANSIPDQSVMADTAWNFLVPANTFEDADGDTLTYGADLADGSALPVWLSFDADTRTFSGTPPLGMNGTVSVRVSAQDNSETAYATFDLNIISANSAPVVANTIGNQEGFEDTPWSYTLPANTFFDSDGDTLSYSATLAAGAPLPTWLTFDEATRTFTSTPPNQPIAIKVTASDGVASVSQTFDLSTSVTETSVQQNWGIDAYLTRGTLFLASDTVASSRRERESGQTPFWHSVRGGNARILSFHWADGKICGYYFVSRTVERIKRTDPGGGISHTDWTETNQQRSSGPHRCPGATSTGL